MATDYTARFTALMDRAKRYNDLQFNNNLNLEAARIMRDGGTWDDVAAYVLEANKNRQRKGFMGFMQKLARSRHNAPRLLSDIEKKIIGHYTPKSTTTIDAPIKTAISKAYRAIEEGYPADQVKDRLRQGVDRHNPKLTSSALEELDFLIDLGGGITNITEGKDRQQEYLRLAKKYPSRASKIRTDLMAGRAPEYGFTTDEMLGKSK